MSTAASSAALVCSDQGRWSGTTCGLLWPTIAMCSGIHHGWSVPPVDFLSAGEVALSRQPVSGRSPCPPVANLRAHAGRWRTRGHMSRTSSKEILLPRLRESHLRESQPRGARLQIATQRRLSRSAHLPSRKVSGDTNERLTALRNGQARPTRQTREKVQRAVQQVDGAGAKSSASRQPHALAPLGLS
jgi:hypothetical protein